MITPSSMNFTDDSAMFWTPFGTSLRPAAATTKKITVISTAMT